MQRMFLPDVMTNFKVTRANGDEFSGNCRQGFGPFSAHNYTMTDGIARLLWRSPSSYLIGNGASSAEIEVQPVSSVL